MADAETLAFYTVIFTGDLFHVKENYEDVGDSSSGLGYKDFIILMHISSFTKYQGIPQGNLEKALNKEVL